MNPAHALYDVPRFGNVSLLHFTDCHGQLLPIYYREPSINLGVGMALGRPPHLVGEALLHAYGSDPCSREAHAFTHLDFNGSWDQLIVEALMQVNDAEIAFSPGFRWGTTLLPGETITREHLMDQTAITYPDTSVAMMAGRDIHETLEKLCDKLFNAEPHQHQGGDMLRTGGLTYACEPAAQKGARISDLRLNGECLDASKSYKVARWGVGTSQGHGEPVWGAVERYLRQSASGPCVKPNVPRLVGFESNPGYARDDSALFCKSSDHG